MHKYIEYCPNSLVWKKLNVIILCGLITSDLFMVLGTQFEWQIDWNPFRLWSYYQVTTWSSWFFMEIDFYEKSATFKSPSSILKWVLCGVNLKLGFIIKNIYLYKKQWSVLNFHTYCKMESISEISYFVGWTWYLRCLRMTHSFMQKL